jgi:hypothetical protein
MTLGLTDDEARVLAKHLRQALDYDAAERWPEAAMERLGLATLCLALLLTACGAPEC